MNSSSTSPTYHNTPLILQILKDLVWIGYLVFLSIRPGPSGNRLSRPAAVVILAMLTWVALLVYIHLVVMGDHLFSTALNFRYAFEYVFIVFVTARLAPVSVEERTAFFNGITRLFKYLFVLSVLYDLFQILNYHFTGRLPALGYPGPQGERRYGSMLDDPNGYSIFLAIPFFWLLSRMFYSRRVTLKTLLGILTILVCQWFTKSFSGWISIAVATFLLVLVRISQSKRGGLLLPLILVTFALIAAALGIIYSGDILSSTIVAEKMGSVKAHFASTTHAWNTIGNFGFSNLIFGARSEGLTSETWYLKAVENFGLPVTLAYVGFILVSARKAFRFSKAALANKDPGTYVMATTLLGFIISVLVGSVFVSYIDVYPISTLLWFSVGLVWSLGLRVSPRGEVRRTRLAFTGHRDSRFEGGRAHDAELKTYF